MDINTQSELFEAKIQPLLTSFEELTDLRFARGIRYKLKSVVTLLFLSKLGGADKSAEIADWVGFRFEFLKKLLDLDWKRSPHEVTWKRILENGLCADEVERVFGKFLVQPAPSRAADVEYGRQSGLLSQVGGKR